MKPEDFITDSAKSYFKVIAAILKKRGMADDAFNLELSMLCQEYAIYQDAVERYKAAGTFVNKHDQISAFITAKDKAMANITKMSPKFGLTPLDLSKIKELVREEEKERKIDQI